MRRTFSKLLSEWTADVRKPRPATRRVLLARGHPAYRARAPRWFRAARAGMNHIVVLTGR
jgi:hypothetical protein